MAINKLNHDYLTIIKLEIFEILEEFSIMSFQEMAELDCYDDWEKKLDEYICVILTFVQVFIVDLFFISNVYYLFFV